MKLEIQAIPAINMYAGYWVMMLLLALSPFFLGRQTLQVLAAGLSLGAVTFLLAHSIKRYFANIKSLSINMSVAEAMGGLCVIVSAVLAGFYLAA